MNFMDFRWDDRKSLNVDVTLACGTKDAVTGVTQNISDGGMYVATNVSDVDLYAHCMVTVKINDKNDEVDNENLNKNLQAMVAYKDERGIGLMFYNNDDNKDPS
ncbi:MAG: PilZ domain-containing protein [Gammaproteobacteria bacterium]